MHRWLVVDFSISIIAGSGTAATAVVTGVAAIVVVVVVSFVTTMICRGAGVEGCGIMIVVVVVATATAAATAIVGGWITRIRTRSHGDRLPERALII